MEIAIIILLIIIIIIMVVKKPKNNIVKSTKSPTTKSIGFKAKAYENEVPEELITKYQYEKTAVLTKTESNFYRDLKEITTKYKLEVFPKVRLADIIKVKKGLDYSSFTSAFNSIKSKHIDFLITDSEYNTLVLIELDDDSHNKKSAIKNDEFKNEVLLTVGIRLIRVKTSDGLEEILLQNLSKV